MPLLALLVCVSLAQPGNDLRDQINVGLKPILVKAVAFPFRSPGAKDAKPARVSLSPGSNAANGSSTEDQWFHAKVLPRPPQPLHEDVIRVPQDTEWGAMVQYHPDEQKRRWAGVYEKAGPRDPERPDTDPGNRRYRYAAALFDKELVPLRLFVLDDLFAGALRMTSMALAGQVMVFSLGAAEGEVQGNGSLVALDTDDGAVLWTTAAGTSSDIGFVVCGKVVFAGAGGKEGKGKVSVVDMATGKTLQELPLDLPPDVMVLKGTTLYVRTAASSYEFPVKDK